MEADIKRDYVKKENNGTGRPALLFLNSNKTRVNISKIAKSYRSACQLTGLDLKMEAVVSKGPDRSIDRDAVNELITYLLTGCYEVVVVKTVEEITEDKADFMEFLMDAANIGVAFFELDTMQFYSCDCLGTTKQMALGKGDVIWE